MKNKAFKILLLALVIVFATASFAACSAVKDLMNEFNGQNDVISVSYIKSITGIESAYKANSVINYDDASVLVVYSNGEEKPVKLSQTSFNKIDTSTLGDKELSVVFKGAIFKMTVHIYVDVTVTKLSTPVGLKVDGNKLSWNAVKNASSYKVYINNREYDSATNSYVFSSQGGGTMTFAVMAVSGSPEFENSDVSQELKVENMVQLAAPTDVKIDKTVLTWKYDGITSDVYFVVKQDGGVAVEKITDTKIDLLSLNLGASDKPYVFSVYACSTDSKKMQSDTAGNAGFKVTRLSQPKNVTLNGKLLSWDRDSKAVKYRITIGENEHSDANNVEVGAASTSYNIGGYFGDNWFTKPASERVGTYTFKVKSIGYRAENAASLEKVNGNGYEYEWLLDSVASSSVAYKVVQLTTPYGLYVEGDAIYWSGDINAAGYNVYIKPNSSGDEVSHYTSDTMFDLSEYIHSSDRYEIRVVATGQKEGLNASEVIDSASSESFEYVYRTPLAAPVITLKNGAITWERIANADSYLLYTVQKGVTGKALTGTRRALNNELWESLGYGSFDFYVIAMPKSGSLYTHSEKSNLINYVNSATLVMPQVTANDTVVSWRKVVGAEYYTVTVNGQTAGDSTMQEVADKQFRVTDLSFDLKALGAGNYTVTVKAENSDSVVYKPSANSTEVGIVVTSKLKTPVSVNVNSDGNIEYSLVASAKKYKVEIFDPDSIKQFECFSSEVLGSNGFYNFEDFLADNQMVAGIYRIDISAYAADEVSEYVLASDVKSYNMRVSALATTTVSIGTRVGAYGDSDYLREVKWQSVKNALGYNVLVDGVVINDTPVTTTNYILSEQTHLSAGVLHQISVVSLGNGKNSIDSEPSSVSIETPISLPIDEAGNITVVPSDVRIEGGKLQWECLDENGVRFADSYTLTITYLADSGEMISKDVEVAQNFYTDFVTGKTYTIRVAANVKFTQGEKTVYSSAGSTPFSFVLNASINAAFADDVITWRGNAGTEYKIYFGDVQFSHVATATGIQSFSVLRAVDTLDAGVYKVRIAEVVPSGESGSSVQQDNVYNSFTTITVLGTPVIKFAGNKIYWDAVTSAEKYIVTIDGQEIITGNTYVDAVLIPEGSSIVRVQAVSTQNKIYSSRIAEDVAEKLSAPDILNDETTISWKMESGITYRIYNVEKGSAILVDVDTASFENFQNNGGTATITGITDLSSVEISATKKGVLNANTWSYPKADDAARAYGIEYGAGTIGVPYIIGTSQAFAALGAFENTYFKVTADLDLGEITPFDVGNGNVVDFRNHVVKYRVFVRAESTKKVGLFASNNGTLKNLNVEASVTLVNLAATSYGSIVAGGVAAVNNGTIENVHVVGIVEGTTHVGGAVGRNDGVIKNVIAEAGVTAKAVGIAMQSYVGGVVGYNVGGTVEGCSSNERDILAYLMEYYNKAEQTIDDIAISANNKDGGAIVGGLIGYSKGASAVISDCYSYCNVYALSEKGHVYAAGLVGRIDDGIKVENCLSTGNALAVTESGNAYAAGFVAASKAEYAFCYSMGMPVAKTQSGATVNAGGFIARRIGGGEPQYCFYNTDTSGIEPVSAFDKGLAITTVELKSMTSFGVENDKWVFFYKYQDKDRPIFFPHLVSERWLVSFDEQSGSVRYTSDLENGLGTIANPISLDWSGPLKFLLFAKNTDLVYFMNSDLDFTNESFIQIPVFTANVWGNGHKIKGVTINKGTDLGFIKRNYGNFYGVTMSGFDYSTSTRDGMVRAGAFAAYNAGILVDCKVESGRISVIALTDSAYVGAYAGVNSGMIWSNVEETSLIAGDHTTYGATVAADVELIGQSKFGKNTVIGAVVGLNDCGYIKWVDAKASVRPVGTNYLKGGICGQNVQPTDEVGIYIDNIIDCMYSENDTMCNEADSRWGTAY